MLGLMVRCCGMDFRRGLGRANERYELALPVMEHKKLLVMHAGDFASRLVIADPSRRKTAPAQKLILPWICLRLLSHERSRRDSRSLGISVPILAKEHKVIVTFRPVFGCAMVFLRLFLTRTHQDNYSRFRWSLADVMQTVEICNSV